MRSVAYEDGKREFPGDIRAGMMTAPERVEAEYGRDELWKASGPGHEEAWQYGHIRGKLVPWRVTFAPLPAAAAVNTPGLTTTMDP
jgi:hypothetical protein